MLPVRCWQAGSPRCVRFRNKLFGRHTAFNVYLELIFLSPCMFSLASPCLPSLIPNPLSCRPASTLLA